METSSSSPPPIDTNGAVNGAELPDSTPQMDYLRSFTRLLIGGTEVGLQELLRQLELWEAEVERWKRQRAANQLHHGFHDDTLPDLEEEERRVDLARYALIGLIFSIQDGARSRIRLASRVQGVASRIVPPFFRPFKVARLLPGYARLDSRFEQLVEQGRHEVDQWIAAGRAEEEHSQLLAGAAFDKTIDYYIEYLTHNPEVKDLVQSQSTGLATEVIEEVRERTVSADTFLEGIARSLLRKIPRSHIPEPPPEVRSSAVHVQRRKREMDER